MTFGGGVAVPERYATDAMEFLHEEVSAHPCLVLDICIGGW